MHLVLVLLQELRHESLQCHDSIRAIAQLEGMPKVYSEQNLINTRTIFEKYQEVAAIAREQETNETVREHVTVIHDLLGGVIEDYNKVVSRTEHV